jgi:hypothetical protein
MIFQSLQAFLKKIKKNISNLYTGALTAGPGVNPTPRVSHIKNKAVV